MDNRIVWLFVSVGMIVGGFVPLVWGGSASASPRSSRPLGGVAGLWAGLKLT